MQVLRYLLQVEYGLYLTVNEKIRQLLKVVVIFPNQYVAIIKTSKQQQTLHGMTYSLQNIGLAFFKQDNKVKTVIIGENKLVSLSSRLANHYEIRDTECFQDRVVRYLDIKCNGQAFVCIIARNVSQQIQYHIKCGLISNIDVITKTLDMCQNGSCSQYSQLYQTPDSYLDLKDIYYLFMLQTQLSVSLSELLYINRFWLLMSNIHSNLLPQQLPLHATIRRHVSWQMGEWVVS